MFSALRSLGSVPSPQITGRGAEFRKDLTSLLVVFDELHRHAVMVQVFRQVVGNPAPPTIITCLNRLGIRPTARETVIQTAWR